MKKLSYRLYNMESNEFEYGSINEYEIIATLFLTIIGIAIATALLFLG